MQAVVAAESETTPMGELMGSLIHMRIMEVATAYAPRQERHFWNTECASNTIMGYGGCLEWPKKCSGKYVARGIASSVGNRV